jgi:hypothetical protein
MCVIVISLEWFYTKVLFYMFFVKPRLSPPLDIDVVYIDLVWFMVFNATFNNISVISWQLVL